MAKAQRTLGPLHFEDLEPHRFEDLLRALIYDFKNWAKLEATGRSGSDEGFDIRGWEAPAPSQKLDQPRDEDEEPLDFIANAKLWLVQCKRERAMGPAKLLSYLETISAPQVDDLDGLIFAAACDFSITARDKFREWCLKHGIEEYHLWGKAELEDALLQPKNDGLLFAFFGISLVVRQRSIRTEIRARLATKKKIIKIAGGVGDVVHAACLFRDAADDRYPKNPENTPLVSLPGQFSYGWFARRIVDVRHNGILVQFRDGMAYLADDGISWDTIKIGDRATLSAYENPWEHPDDFQTESEAEYAAQNFWQQLPLKNRARVKSWGFIPYDAILAIDEDGDGETNLPTIFVSFDSNGPFKWGVGRITAGDKEVANDPKTKRKFFPDIFPAPLMEPLKIPD